MQLVELRKEAKEVGMPTSGTFLLVGDIKAGKTTLGASFPDSYVLELEKKRGDRIKNARIHDIDNLADFGDALELAMAAPDIKVIVIDSVDQLAKWFQAEIAKDNGVEFFGKPVKGVDSHALWGEFNTRVHGMTDYLNESDKLIIMIAHRRTAKIDSDGKVIKPAGINVAGQGGDYIAQQAKIVGFMGVRVVAGKAQHYLTFKGESDRAIWRSGIDELNDKEVVIRKEDPYGSFAALFAPVASKAPVKLAPKPVAGKRR